MHLLGLLLAVVLLGGLLHLFGGGGRGLGCLLRLDLLGGLPGGGLLEVLDDAVGLGLRVDLLDGLLQRAADGAGLLLLLGGGHLPGRAPAYRPVAARGAAPGAGLGAGPRRLVGAAGVLGLGLGLGAARGFRLTGALGLDLGFGLGVGFFFPEGSAIGHITPVKHA